MTAKRKLALIPSAYNENAMGDVENFIKYYKDDFDVFVIVNREIENDVEVVDGVSYVRKESPFGMYIEATADYIIDAGAISGNRKVWPAQKRISVWHGIPYKKMFVDLAKEHVVTAMEYTAGMDLMISPSKWYTDRFLRQSMLYKGEVLETAVSRTDSLYIGTEEKESLKKRFGIGKDKKILLYAPTFRQEGEFVLPFSAKKMIEILGEDWEIMVKAHYINTLANTEGVINATDYPSVNNLLAIADFLITDYSSVLFDYSVLDKPGLLYQYDREQYEKERAFMFDMEDYVDTKDILFNEEDLYERLKQIDILGSNFSNIKKNFYPHQKENATEDLVKKLDLDSSEYGLNEVVFLVNDLNEIGGVHAFILNLAKQFKEKYGTKIIVIGIDEYNRDKNEIFCFDKENLIDIKLSYEISPRISRAILKGTNGYIISCQYSAHKKFQEFIGNKKAVLMFHGDAKDVKERTLYKWHLDSLNNGEIKNYRRLAFLTERNCELISDALDEGPRGKLIAMENGMDFSGKKNLYKQSGEFVLVGRLDPDKNPMEAIDLFADGDLDPAYKLHVYGDGSLRNDMQNRIDELGLSDRIILHGFESDKEKIYGGKQGLISINTSEGLPFTFLEASKYGIPVYAYDAFTSCRDLVDESNGVLVDTHDIKGFVKALNDPFDISGFDTARVEKAFSNEEVTERWIELFKELDREAPGKESVAYYSKTVARKEAPVQRLKKRIRKSRLFRNNSLYGELSVKWRNFKSGNKQKQLPLVSVIMPFYNNNATIKAAVRSVEKCGYDNYEILLVNDGSTQDPRKVIGDNRKKVKYFYKENGGLSSTRNYAIDRASGKYVFFLDSDDTIYPGSLYRLVSLAEKNDLKMVSGKTIRYYVEDDFEEAWYSAMYRNTYVNEMNRRKRLIDDTIATSKLYNRAMLNEMGLRFKDGLYEDILFTGELYAKLDRIGIEEHATQKWMVYGNNTSITTKHTLKNDLARLKNVDAVFEMQQLDLMRVYYTRQYIRHHMVSCVNGSSRYSEEERKELFDVLKKGMQLRKPYVVDKLIKETAKKELYKSLLNDDYESFCMLADAYSERYEKGTIIQEKKRRKNERKE